MDDFTFIDALSGDSISLDFSTGEARAAHSEVQDSEAKSIFFPGCSLLNYAMPLLRAVYGTLLEAGAVDGISILCCGKILSYEPNGTVLRDSFEEQLRCAVYERRIEKFVCACPNCVKALRDAFALDPRTKDVKIEALPQVMADLGYRLDKRTCARLVKGDENADILFAIHDSCPDREYGQFARGIRAITPDDIRVDPEHSWKRSVCCGSLPRAAGKFAQADKCADLNGREALDVGADAILTACMSCDFQLNMAQPHVQCVHFLEMLYNWRVDWTQVGQYMKLRFLFNDTLGAIDEDSDRNFEGLGNATRVDIAASGQDGACDALCQTESSDVSFSNKNVVDIGE